MRVAVVAVLLALPSAVAWQACGAAQRPTGERLNLSKCGACHPRSAPGRFDRTAWEAILESHRSRVPLDEAQRRDLLDYLSAPAGP